MPGLLIGVFVLSVRFLPLLLWLPGLSRLSRLLLWLVCALFVASRGLDRLPGLAVAETPLSLAPLLAQELAVGLLLLLLFAVLWGALQSVARLLGLGLWADDQPDDSAAPARLPSTLIQIFSLCGTALFFVFDGVGVLLAVFGKSYELLPLPGSDLEPAPWLLTASRLYAIGTRLFALTLVLALPVVVPRLLAQAAVALVLRSGTSPVSSPTASVAGSLGPIWWLVSLCLGGGLVLALWLQQGPSLLRLWLVV